MRTAAGIAAPPRSARSWLCASVLALAALSGCATQNGPKPGAVPLAAIPEAPAPDAPQNPGLANEAQAARVPQDGKVHIRLLNNSDSALEQVTVAFPTDSAQAAFIRPGGYSPYFPAQGAYRYAFVRAVCGGKVYFCQPIDFAGETPLAPGRYTYALSRVKNRDPESQVGFLLLELIEDGGQSK